MERDFLSDTRSLIKNNMNWGTCSSNSLLGGKNLSTERKNEDQEYS
jgi:hypothetical protein